MASSSVDYLHGEGGEEAEAGSARGCGAVISVRATIATSSLELEGTSAQLTCSGKAGK
jgi:hypothetical protein